MRVLTDKYFVAFGTSMCYYIFRRKTNVFLRHTFDKAKRDLIMADKYQYYVLDKKAVPDVLLKVVDAKRLLESGRASSVQEATDQVGISRSSFYKYKDDISPSMMIPRGRPSPGLSRWMMKADCYRTY